MATAFREYVSAHGLGSLSTCTEAMHSLALHIDSLNTQGPRANYWARVLSSEEDAEDEVLDIEPLTKITGGVYPALWFNITYDPDVMAEDEFRAMEERFALRIFSAGAASHNTPF